MTSSDHPRAVLRTPTQFGFGLWLRLDERSEARCADYNARLNEELGGPTITPHVTLLAHQPLVAVRRAGSQLPREGFDLVLRAPQVGAAPFQALTLAVDDGGRCKALRAKASGAPDARYAPHVSLYYGPAPRRVPVWLERELETEPLRARAHSLELWDLRGRVSDWRSVTRWPLSS